MDRKPVSPKRICGACGMQKGSKERWCPILRLSDEKREILRLPSDGTAPVCVCRACALWADYQIKARRKETEREAAPLFQSLSSSLMKLERRVSELESLAKAMDVAGFKDLCDATADGLFTALEGATSPKYGCSQATEEKHGQRIVFLIMLMMRYRNQSVSAFADMMSDYLSANGMSYDGQILFSKYGVALSPSAHEKRVHGSDQKSPEIDEECTYVGIVDDFNWLDVRSTPDVSGHFSKGHTLANIVVKRVPGSMGPCLLAKGPNDEPLKNWRKADGWRVDAMLEEYKGSPGTNWTLTADLFGHLARALAPYDTRRLGYDSESPVSLENVTLLDSYEEGMKSKVSIGRAVQHFAELAHDCFSGGRAVIVTGDWHIYKGFSDYIERQGDMHEQMLLLPGGFHISLNLQQAVFEHYGNVIERLWKKADPYSKFTSLSCFQRPVRRKFVLDVLNESWARVRENCLQLLQNASDASIEAFALVHLFENVIPIACSLYGAQLNGNIAVYLSTLCRALILFMQFGKRHYYGCCCRLLSDLHFWKQYRPDVFSFVSCNICHLSEEEIEIFHSTIRPILGNVKTTTERGIAKVKHFDAIKHEQMELKRAMNVGVKRKRGFCIAQKAWLGDESQCHMLDQAIADILASTLRNDLIFKPAKKDDNLWSTHHLGALKDTALPLPLQSRSELRGCSQAHLSERVQHDGWVQGIPQLHICGHPRHDDQDRSCERCRKMNSELVCVVCSHSVE